VLARALANVEQKPPATVTATIRGQEKTIPLVDPDMSVNAFMEKYMGKTTVPHPITGKKVTISALRKEATPLLSKTNGAKAAAPFTKTINATRQTLNEMYKAGRSAYDDWAKTASANLSDAQKAQVDAATAGTEAARKAVSAAPGAAQRVVSGAPRYALLKGKALETWKAQYKDILREEDMTLILSAKTPQEAEATVAKVLARRDKMPIFERVYMTSEGLTYQLDPETLGAVQKGLHSSLNDINLPGDVLR